jgi:hypothetical protein
MAFKKGQSGNPKGRQKGVPNKRTGLMNAIKHVQGRKKKKLLVHAVEMAYEDNRVLVALLKKLVPDMKAVEMSGDADLNIEIVNYGDYKLSPNLQSTLDAVYRKKDK